MIHLRLTEYLWLSVTVSLIMFLKDCKNFKAKYLLASHSSLKVVSHVFSTNFFSLNLCSLCYIKFFKVIHKITLHAETFISSNKQVPLTSFIITISVCSVVHYKENIFFTVINVTFVSFTFWH